MQYYAHKGFLISVNKAEDDGLLETRNGKTKIFKGNLIACDELGDSCVMSEGYFRDNYIPVEKVKVIPEFTDEQIREFSDIEPWSLEPFEDEEYIEDFQRKVRERNKLNELDIE